MHPVVPKTQSLASSQLIRRFAVGSFDCSTADHGVKPTREMSQIRVVMRVQRAPMRFAQSSAVLGNKVG